MHCSGCRSCCCCCIGICRWWWGWDQDDSDTPLMLLGLLTPVPPPPPPTSTEPTECRGLVTPPGRASARDEAPASEPPADNCGCVIGRGLLNITDEVRLPPPPPGAPHCSTARCRLLFREPPCSTAQHSTAQHNTAQHNIAEPRSAVRTRDKPSAWTPRQSPKGQRAALTDLGADTRRHLLKATKVTAAGRSHSCPTGRDGTGQGRRRGARPPHLQHGEALGAQPVA